MEYERKLPANPSGTRKASADHSPERRGRKRERSSSYYANCCESLSPPRRSTPSRTLCSPSPSPTRGRREKMRSTKGKSDRISYSRSPSPRRHRRPSTPPPRRNRRTPSPSPRRRCSGKSSGRSTGRSSWREDPPIPGLSRKEAGTSSRLTGREFSPEIPRSCSKPSRRRSRTPPPPPCSPGSPVWEQVTSRRRIKAH